MNLFLGKYYVPDGTKPIETKLKMPIEWIPLETKDNETLLISKNVLDWECYGFEGSEWSFSYLKEYLEKLYEDFFSEEEKDIIIDKSFGKLFVLTKEELETYMPNSDARKASMFYVDKMDGGMEVFLEHSTYWLRKDLPCEMGNEAPFVDSLGNFALGSPQMDEIGIRPAMYVDTRMARLLSAKAGYNEWHHLWKFDEF